MSIKIGAISISLNAETASFQSDMQKASAVALSSSKAIEKSFTMMATAMTAAIGSTVGALGLLIGKTQDTVEGMQRMAAQAGVGISAFSKLAYAAKIAGMPVDQMATILTRISHSSFEAASGNKQAAAAYKLLGVSVTDASGHFRTADEIALSLAKSLNQYKDSAAKTGIETMLMGRSGAEAASFLSVLANRFDETSATAQKLGVVFNEQTAEGARNLHDSFVAIEEAGLGLSVRLLQQVSPALDDLTQKIVAITSNAETMRKIDDIGHELAEGIHVAGEAMQFLIDHFDGVKHSVEALAALRLAGMFGPMVLSAAEANNFLGKLGIASLNLTGNLLGIRRVGSTVVPVLTGLGTASKSYALGLASINAEMGAATAASFAFTDAMVALRAMTATLAATVPIAALAAGGFYEFAMAVKSAHEYSEVKSETGASWWEVQKAEAKEATSSVQDFFGWLQMVAGLQSDANEHGFYSRVAQRLGAKDPMAGSPKAPGLPSDYYTNSAMGGPAAKKNLPALPQEGKPDELAKKLAELTEKAAAAQRALALVGTTPQQQRDSEILEKYNLFLADEAFLLNKLTPAKRAAAEASARQAITDEVNFTAATKYRQALYDLSQATGISIAEHNAMAAAIGRSAQAMQDAAVAAQVNSEFNKSGGPNWQSDPEKAADAQKRAAEIRADINAANAQDDAKSLTSGQLQLDAQNRLNEAILKGSEAKRQAAIANEQAAIRAQFADRSDTDTDAMQRQIDMVREKSDAEDEAANRERASRLDIIGLYHEQLTALNDAVEAAQRAGVALDFRQVLAADKEAFVQFNEAQDKAILATGDMADGFHVALAQMARDTESTAQRIYEAMTGAVDAMNDAITSIATQKHKRGDHFVSNAFSGAFRGIGSNLAKSGLQKGESALLKGFGMAGKPDGSSQNPWYVKLVNSFKGATNFSGSGGTNELNQLLKSGNSSDSGGNAVGSFIGKALAFLPMFADGTDATVPGMPSIVGEKGPEIFIPPSAGAIVPNSKLGNLGGHSITNHIDARGATDPAQTVALINQALEKAAPQIVAHSVKAVHEVNARIPSQSRK